jgi:hypothetical protein
VRGVLLAFLLAGCSADLRLGPAFKQQPPIIVPPGDKVVETPDETIVEPVPQPQCFQRARHFAGLVQRPCADVAGETR